MEIHFFGENEMSHHQKPASIASDIYNSVTMKFESYQSGQTPQ